MSIKYTDKRDEPVEMAVGDMKPGQWFVNSDGERFMRTTWLDSLGHFVCVADDGAAFPIRGSKRHPLDPPPKRETVPLGSLGPRQAFVWPDTNRPSVVVARDSECGKVRIRRLCENYPIQVDATAQVTPVDLEIIIR